MIENSKHRARIAAHYASNWDVAGHQIEFTRGPIHELPPDFGILEFASSERRRMWTYATCGMSQPGDNVPIELHMFSAIQARGIVELLIAAAHYHRTAEPLDLGHTINFGTPWSQGSKCEYGLVSLPYLDGPKLEKLDIDGKRVADFYWLIPISKSEVEFKKRDGLDALEKKFDEPLFNYLDPHRKSVV